MQSASQPSITVWEIHLQKMCSLSSTLSLSLVLCEFSKSNKDVLGCGWVLASENNEIGKNKMLSDKWFQITQYVAQLNATLCDLNMNKKVILLKIFLHHNDHWIVSR